MQDNEIIDCNRPLVSIIVPVYNVENYLERCLRSIVNQTYNNLEIILVDDGSTDRSGKMCDDWSVRDRRIIVKHKINGGLASARNAGLEISNGTFIEFVDSDDWIALDTVEYCLDTIRRHCELDAVHFEIQQVFDEQSEIVHQENEIYVFEGKEILQWFMSTAATRAGYFSSCTLLFRKIIVKDISFQEGIVNEDIAWKYKVLSRMRRLAVSNAVKYFYFQRLGSITTAGLRKKDFDLYVAVAELRSLTAKEQYGSIRYLGEVKFARTPLSLLCKIAYYGIADLSIDKSATVAVLQKELRNNWRLLIGSPIPFSRKILTVMFALNYLCTELAIRLIKLLKMIK